MSGLERQVIAVLGRSTMLPEATLTPDARLASLGIGSLEQIECILELEDVFQIELPEPNLQKLQTVQDVIDLVQRATAAKPQRPRR